MSSNDLVQCSGIMHSNTIYFIVIKLIISANFSKPAFLKTITLQIVR